VSVYILSLSGRRLLLCCIWYRCYRYLVQPLANLTPSAEPDDLTTSHLILTSTSQPHSAACPIEPPALQWERGWFYCINYSVYLLLLLLLRHVFIAFTIPIDIHITKALRSSEAHYPAASRIAPTHRSTTHTPFLPPYFNPGDKYSLTVFASPHLTSSSSRYQTTHVAPSTDEQQPHLQTPSSPLSSSSRDKSTPEPVRLVYPPPWSIQPQRPSDTPWDGDGGE